MSADTIVPGAADGSGGGAATLGYDSSTRLSPLTPDFHEFIGQVTDENQAVLQYGPFFQWSDRVKKDHPIPMGPLNPQALNRYSYVLNNPLRYVDPTGHDAVIVSSADLLKMVMFVEKLQEFYSNGAHSSGLIATGLGVSAGAMAASGAYKALVAALGTGPAGAAAGLPEGLGAALLGLGALAVGADSVHQAEIATDLGKLDSILTEALKVADKSPSHAALLYVNHTDFDWFMTVGCMSCFSSPVSIGDYSWPGRNPAAITMWGLITAAQNGDLAKLNLP